MPTNSNNFSLSFFVFVFVIVCLSPQGVYCGCVTSTQQTALHLLVANREVENSLSLPEKEQLFLEVCVVFVGLKMKENKERKREKIEREKREKRGFYEYQMIKFEWEI